MLKMLEKNQKTVKHVPPVLSQHTGSPPWKTQAQSSDDNLSASSDSSPFQSPSRTLDISGSSTSFSSDRAKIAAAHQWKSGPVEQWNNEQVKFIARNVLCMLITNYKIISQVCHWLLGINMEHQVPKFIEHSVEGGRHAQNYSFKI